MNKCTILFLVHIQSAVADLEKALDTPSNVMIYKQHWDYYARTPGLLHGLAINDPLQTLYWLMSSRYGPTHCPLRFLKLNYSRIPTAMKQCAVGRLAAAPSHDPLKIQNK